MLERPDGFLNEDNIALVGEVFDYIKELHEYLWRFVRAGSPDANGTLDDLLDSAVEQAEQDTDCQECEAWRDTVEMLQAGADRLREKLADTEEKRDATYRKYVSTFSDLVKCKNDLAQLRQGLADLLV